MLRAAIHAAVPGLTETISYNMPTFRLRTNLVYYAVHKNLSSRRDLPCCALPYTPLCPG